MAYNKVWTIKNGVKRSIDYVNDRDKTTVKGSLDYIGDERKTTNGKSILVSGHLCNPKTAVMEFKMREDEYHEHKSENLPRGIIPNQAIHIIQSFSENDSKNMTPEELHELGMEYAKRICGNHFQAVIASHLNNPDQLHNHILINAYAKDGYYKFIEDRETLKRIREISNDLSKEYGLEVIEPNGLDRVANYKEWQEKQDGTSWKEQIRQDITATMKVSNTWYDFKMYLENAGYEIKENTNSISYKAPGNPYFVRDTRLGKAYERAALLEYWQQAKEVEQPEIEVPIKKDENLEQSNKPKNIEDVQVSEYDLHGKKRSPLEILLLTTIKKLKHLENTEVEVKEPVIDNAIYARVDYKLQNMLDTLALTRENNIQTQEDLSEKISEVATDRNNLKNKLDADNIQIQNMQRTINDINDFFELEEIVDNIEVDGNILNLEVPSKETILEARALEDPMSKKQKMELFKLMENETEYKLDAKFSQITRTEAIDVLAFLKDKTQPQPKLVISVEEFEKKREAAKEAKINENKKSNIDSRFEKVPVGIKEKIQINNLLKQHPEILLKHEVANRKEAMEVLAYFKDGGSYPDIFVSARDVAISKLSLDDQATVKSYLALKQKLYNLGLTDMEKIAAYKVELKEKINTFADEREEFKALGKEYAKFKRMEYNLELAKNSAYTQGTPAQDKVEVKEADIDKEVEAIQKENNHDYRREDKHFRLDEDER